MNDANIVDENLNQGYRGLEDIRQINIKQEGELLVAIAYYIDKSKADGFKGYWYGWQMGGRGPVWTPLGYSKSSIPKPDSNFLEIHVYKYEVKGEDVSPSNTFGTWVPISES